ncbi:cation diffusion facilitator family transporter [Naasia lichenicola]|uniref:Cation transporter n=1 Tax=Naasia lichenicola TaxID=2565933 RepID=A0A4S4FFL7_9MICO|nr:cation diffusion facilitator family transporter [Naasia lichenicola]THG28522.1 cation transporter [Naasia lichenicola]
MHDHDSAAHGSSSRRRLAIALGITAAFLVVEVVGALITGSLTLLADAGHMASDVIALVIALVASAVAARPPSERSTFGYRRAEVLGAMVNALLLIGVALWVGVEAVIRLLSVDRAEILGGPMLIVAIVGLGANIAAALVLRSGTSESMNVRGAYLEVLGDMIGSVAAIVAGIVIVTTGFDRADSIASLAVAALIVPRAIALLRDVTSVLTESAPTGTSVAEIRSHILGTDGVVDAHDVHVWQITAGAPVFTAHVVVEPGVLESGGADDLLDRLSKCLVGHFDVAHSTFQLEPATHADHEESQHA